jgi:hypothetical protein
MFKHGIHHRQQFTHTGRQRDLWRVAGLTQPLIERFQDAIMTRRHQRAHIEGRPHSGAATPDGPFSAEGAAVPIQRGDPHQCSDLSAGQGPQLRQLRQQGPRDDGTDAWDTLQQLVVFPPNRAGLNRCGQLLIELRTTLSSSLVQTKIQGESKPEAYPQGYVEDYDEPRTPLADFFSILPARG